MKLEGWYRPMGLRLRVESDRPELLALAEETFRGFGPAPAEADADLTFILESGPAGGVLGEPRFDPASRRQTAGSAAELAVEGSVARGRFSPAAWQSPAFLRLHFLELALYLLLPGRGFLGVHASACVRHGRAALLRAPGGGGKTTLAYAAARGRFQALAEDVVWIAPDGGAWWGMPWRFRLRPDAARLFSELADVNVGAGLAPAREGVNPSPTSRKIEVDVANAAPSALPGPVVLLRRRPGGLSRLEPIGPAEALIRWEEGRSGNEGETPDYAARVGSLLAEGAYALEVGDGPGGLDAALDCLDEALSAASRRNPSSAATGPSQV